MEERKRKFLELKKTTKCTACGQTGHWHGDLECPKKDMKPTAQMSTMSVPPPPRPYRFLYDDSEDDDAGDFTDVRNDKVAFVVTGPSDEPPPTPLGRRKGKGESASSTDRSGKPTGETSFAYGPFEGEQYGHVAQSRDKKHNDWIDTNIEIAQEKRAKYQDEFVQYLIECGRVVEEEVEFVSASTEATAEIEEKWKD